eukprot:7387847-Prymnesium_polylepis.2
MELGDFIPNTMKRLRSLLTFRSVIWSVYVPKSVGPFTTEPSAAFSTTSAELASAATTLASDVARADVGPGGVALRRRAGAGEGGEREPVQDGLAAWYLAVAVKLPFVYGRSPYILLAQDENTERRMCDHVLERRPRVGRRRGELSDPAITISPPLGSCVIPTQPSSAISDPIRAPHTHEPSLANLATIASFRRFPSAPGSPSSPTPQTATPPSEVAIP